MVWQSLLQNWVRSRVQQAAVDAAKRAATGTGSESKTAAETPQSARPQRVDVAIIAALGMELGGLVDRLSGVVTTHAAGFKAHHGGWQGRGLLLVESGMGRERAGRATEAVIGAHRPPWIISTGFAGGLSDEVARYAIVAANSIGCESGDRLAIDFKLDPAGRPNLHVGRILTVDRIVRTPAEKRRLGREHHALAVDMETYAVAEVCRRERTRFIAVRVVSDAADDELPPDLEKLLKQHSTARKLGAALGSIFHRPGSVKDMWRLKEQAIVASDRLAEFLLGVIEQLPAARADAMAP